MPHSKISQFTSEPETIAKIYNALMVRLQCKGFSPKSLDLSKIDTPIVKLLKTTSGEVIEEQLEELLATSGLMAIGQNRLRQMMSGQININWLNHLMPKLGWYKTKRKWGAKDHERRIWVKNDYSVYRGRVTGPDEYDYEVDNQPGVQGFELLETAA